MVNSVFESLVQELLDCLKSELTGNFESVVVGLMMPGPVYDAYELRNAIKVSEDRGGNVLGFIFKIRDDFFLSLFELKIFLG